MIPRNFLASAMIAFAGPAPGFHLFVESLQIGCNWLRSAPTAPVLFAPVCFPAYRIRPLRSVSFEFETRGTMPK